MASEKPTRMELGMRMARHSILKEINKDSRQRNMVFSPLCFHMALNMLASASTGRTLQQLLHFLQFESIADLNEQSSLFMKLIESNHESPGPTIYLVNGIWVNNRYQVKLSFQQLAEDVYRAKAESVDFNKAEKVANEINNWAKEASRGHINLIVGSRFFKKDLMAILASAVYFNGSWLSKFSPKNTKDEYFHLLNGETVKVPFMKRGVSQNFYGRFEGFELLNMRYASGGNGKSYSMYVFLPDKKDGLPELMRKFDSNPNSFLENLRVSPVMLRELWMPKLKFECELNLKRSMKELGLDLIFDDKEGEITEMVESSETMFVSDVIQKSYIEVKEEGTVATSITTKVKRGCLIMEVGPSSPSFIADHPFMFMIKEEVSGSVLFVGVALNPLSEITNKKGAGKKRKMKSSSTKEKKKKHK